METSPPEKPDLVVELLISDDSPRRTFLRRVGAALGFAGAASLVAGCDPESGPFISDG